MISTSIGQEGLDFHSYCHSIYHWNLPNNPVDLEQREGRIHRYKGHVIRKNIAKVHSSAISGAKSDPWEQMFKLASEDILGRASELSPYWIYDVPEGFKILRNIPAVPLSRESGKIQQLLKTLTFYRLAFGQPRQEDLIRFLNIDTRKFMIDLSPPTSEKDEK